MHSCGMFHFFSLVSGCINSFEVAAIIDFSLSFNGNSVS